MDMQQQIFAMALNLPDPWYVEDVGMKQPSGSSQMELHIRVNYKRGAHFKCPGDDCNELCPVYDTAEHTWRHLNFFQYKAFITARVPRIQCKNHGVKTVDVPWARPNSGFTMLFEMGILLMVKEMPVDTVAQLIDEHDTRLWRVINHYTTEARKKVDMSDVVAIGMDETNTKGQNYITVVMDMHSHRVLFATKGKDSTTVSKFVEDFKAHNGNTDRIKVVTSDMSLAFEKGIQENFSQSHLVIDKFHVIKHLNEGVDAVRKAEVEDKLELKRSKYIWLKNKENLTEKQQKKLESMIQKHPKVSRAYAMRCEMQDIYSECVDHATAEKRIKKLISWMMRSRLEPMKKCARMIKNHLADILNYFTCRFTNALLEGTNSVIQNVKRRARGFRNTDYFINMIYLIRGQLPLETVTNDWTKMNQTHMI